MLLNETAGQVIAYPGKGAPATALKKKIHLYQANFLYIFAVWLKTRQFFQFWVLDYREIMLCIFFSIN